MPGGEAEAAPGGRAGAASERDWGSRVRREREGGEPGTEWACGSHLSRGRGSGHVVRGAGEHGPG